MSQQAAVEQQVWEQAWNSVNQVGSRVWNQVGDQVEGQAWDRAKNQAWNQFGQAWDRVCEQAKEDTDGSKQA